MSDFIIASGIFITTFAVFTAILVRHNTRGGGR